MFSFRTGVIKISSACTKKTDSSCRSHHSSEMHWYIRIEENEWAVGEYWLTWDEVARTLIYKAEGLDNPSKSSFFLCIIKACHHNI